MKKYFYKCILFMLIISSIDAKEKLILELIGFDKQTELFEFDDRKKNILRKNRRKTA